MPPQPDIYEDITNRIITHLEKGVVPWKVPLRTQGANQWPSNRLTGEPYHGVNVFMLAVTAWAEGYASSRWLTYRQAKELGGHVRKGEGSTPIVFWKQYTKEDKDTGKDKNIPVLRRYRVFNLDQCDGIDKPEEEQYEPLNFQPIEEAERIVRGYLGRPSITHKGLQARYRPTTDQVFMPPREVFDYEESYYATLFHELAHSTGHSKRLDRGLDIQLKSFGDADYSREELIAEMASAYLCGHAGIAPATIESNAAYLQAWIKQLKGDKRLIIQAAGKAKKAARWIVEPDHGRSAAHAPIQSATLNGKSR